MTVHISGCEAIYHKSHLKGVAVWPYILYKQIKVIIPVSIVLLLRPALAATKHLLKYHYYRVSEGQKENKQDRSQKIVHRHLPICHLLRIY